MTTNNWVINGRTPKAWGKKEYHDFDILVKQTKSKLYKRMGQLNTPPKMKFKLKGGTTDFNIKQAISDAIIDAFQDVIDNKLPKDKNGIIDITSIDTHRVARWMGMRYRRLHGLTD